VVKVSVYIAKDPGEERALSLMYWPTCSGQLNYVCFLVHREEVVECMAIDNGQPHSTTSQIYDLQKAVLNFHFLINDADPG
jgi:hypothetical protein